jgi:hypothetical protein
MQNSELQIPHRLIYHGIINLPHPFVPSQNEKGMPLHPLVFVDFPQLFAYPS